VRGRRPAGPNIVTPGWFSPNLEADHSSSQSRLRSAVASRLTAVRQLDWENLLRPEVMTATVLMLVYWAAWHVFIFHVFRHNASEYYPRIPFNLYCFARLRYYPQLFSACGYLLPFLFIFRKHVHDPQLRLWMWAIPGWYAVMMFWGILVETRVFGELLPFIACVAVLIAEEAVTAAVLARRPLDRTVEDDRVHLVRAA